MKSHRFSAKARKGQQCIAMLTLSSLWLNESHFYLFTGQFCIQLPRKSVDVSGWRNLVTVLHFLAFLHCVFPNVFSTESEWMSQGLRTCRLQMEGSGNAVSDTVTVTVPQKVSGCLRTCRWRVLVTLLLSNFWSPSVCPVNAHQYSMIHKEKSCTHFQ